MPLLEVKDLTVTFGNGNFNTAVNNLNFSLEPAETLGIVGESGSGKTLTGLSIIGLLPPEAKVYGNIFIRNETVLDILSLPEKEKQKFRGSLISMIFQEPMTALNPVMFCGRQVEEILHIHTNLSYRERKLKVLELFNEVLLPDPNSLYYKYPHQLSGGQRQRVMIAMAVACNPQILIADEPTTALDLTVQQSILKLIKKLQVKHKLTVIFISHDLSVVSKISDKIIVMYRGNLIESGLTKEILRKPKNPYTKGLISCKPRFDMRYKRLPVVEDFTQNKNSDKKFDTISTEERRKILDKLYSDEPVLSISNIHSFYVQKFSFFGKPKNIFHALTDINLKLWKGETLGLVGESGSGKTTLGRTLMHLIENTQGKILFHGKDVSILKGKELVDFRKRIQLIFQDPYSSLNPNHTIGYSILEPMIVHNIFKTQNERRTRVKELMRMTELDWSWFHRYPHQLSGGQRQRVVLARALSLQPEILICDESVSSLDVSIQAQILNLLNDLKKQLGLTYIFISHDLSVVKYMSDRIIIMKDGKIIEEGETDEICSNPKEEYTNILFKAAFY